MMRLSKLTRFQMDKAVLELSDSTYGVFMTVPHTAYPAYRQASRSALKGIQDLRGVRQTLSETWFTKKLHARRIKDITNDIKELQRRLLTYRQGFYEPEKRLMRNLKGYP